MTAFKLKIFRTKNRGKDNKNIESWQNSKLHFQITIMHMFASEIYSKQTEKMGKYPKLT